MFAAALPSCAALPDMRRWERSAGIDTHARSRGGVSVAGKVTLNGYWLPLTCRRRVVGRGTIMSSWWAASLSVYSTAYVLCKDWIIILCKEIYVHKVIAYRLLQNFIFIIDSYLQNKYWNFSKLSYSGLRDYRHWTDITALMYWKIHLHSCPSIDRYNKGTVDAVPHSGTVSDIDHLSFQLITQHDRFSYETCSLR